jgi:hypothetical protein
MGIGLTRRCRVFGFAVGGNTNSGGKPKGQPLQMSRNNIFEVMLWNSS